MCSICCHASQTIDHKIIRLEVWKGHHLSFISKSVWESRGKQKNHESIIHQQHLPPPPYPKTRTLHPHDLIQKSIPNINFRHILNKVLLPARAREPQVPRDDIRLNRVANVTRVTDSRHHALALFERGFDARAAQLLVGVKGFFHGVGLALFDPPRQAAGEEDGVFEDDAGGFALGGHGVLGGES